MKKVVVLSFSLLFALPIIAQNAQGSKAVHKTSTGATVSPEKSKMLCKAWKLDSVEEFGVVHAANAKQKADGVTYMADGTFFITMDGEAATGKWTGNGNPYVYASTGTPEVKKMYKIISLSDNKFVMEYQTEDLIRIHYIYSPK
jgi:hypothetical protein